MSSDSLDIAEQVPSSLPEQEVDDDTLSIINQELLDELL